MIPVFHGYYRSSAAFRVRIALALKGIETKPQFHHLRKGEQRSKDYLQINPQGLVPSLEVSGAALTQSLAIIEYLEETYPEPALLPKDPRGRARVRSLSLAIACDIHPINNLRVLNYLRETLGQGEDAVRSWFLNWITEGFEAIETRLAEPETGRFMHGDHPTMADICLIPQIINAGNFNMDLQAYPRIMKVHDAALELSAFSSSLPARQPDAE